MEIDRRRFMALPGALAAGSLVGKEAAVSWHQTVRRVGQLNMTEHDPAVMNVEEWADYWASLKVNAVLISVTGILAFYPSEVPFHRRAKYLGNRDFFGECCSAAKKRGIRVIARMSPDLNWEDALKAHPEWFERDAEGKPRTTSDDARLFRTCMFTTYFTDYIPAIMREVNARYDIDGIFTNGWPPLGQLPICHCAQCKRLPEPRTAAYWDKFNERTIELWKLYDEIAKQKSRENLYFANLGGSIKAGPNLKQLADVCQWFNCDNQGRGGEAGADLGMFAAGQSGERNHEGAHGDKCNRCVVDGNAALAQRGEIDSRSADVDERDGRKRHGALVSLYRRGGRPGTGSPMAGTGTQIFHVAGTARRTFR